MKPIALTPRRTIIPATAWLFCQRCDQEFQTLQTRDCCPVCEHAQEATWPGVVEAPFALSGS